AGRCAPRRGAARARPLGPPPLTSLRTLPSSIRSALVATLVAAGALAPSSARAERPLLAVVPFTGPGAKPAEGAVVHALRKKAQLVPPETWAKSARKLFAGTHSPEDVAAVAADVGARIVVTGVVKRDGRAWQLVVSVRDGKSGRSYEKLKYPLK